MEVPASRSSVDVFLLSLLLQDLGLISIGGSWLGLVLKVAGRRSVVALRKTSVHQNKMTSGQFPR